MQKKNLLEKNFSRDNFIKILSIFSFFLLIVVLTIISFTPAASGYELSIYSAYPWYFWLFIIVIDFIAIILLVKEIFNDKDNTRWILSFFIFWLCNLILLLLPIFRGYFFYGGANCDIYSHYGWIKEISNLGHLSSNNFYPIIHIFIKTISDITGISVAEVIRFIPALFSLLYSIFMLILAKSISKNKGQIILITTLSLPLSFSFYHLTIHPAYFSFVFLPLFLYLYHKKNASKRKLEITIIILIFCFFIVFFHPITSLFSIIIFTIFILSSILFSKRKFLSKDGISDLKISAKSNFLLILIISFFAWYISFGWGINSIKSVIHNLIYGSDFTISSYYLSVLNISNITINQIIQLIIIKYGSILIYILIAAICLTLLIKDYLLIKKIKVLEFFYGIQIILIFSISVFMMFFNFIEGNPIRVFRFFVMLTIIFSGLVIYHTLNRIKSKKEYNLIFHFTKSNSYKSRHLTNKLNLKTILSIFIIFLLFFETVLCIYNLYPSPISYEPNRQFTYMEFTGSLWIEEKRDINLQISGDSGFNLTRIEHYINGVEIGETLIKKEMIKTPSHFGYQKNETILQTFNNTTTYLVITENGIQAVHAFPENVQQLVHQWTEEDFKKLNIDKTANKIYTNKEFELWQILEK